MADDELSRVLRLIENPLDEMGVEVFDVERQGAHVRVVLDRQGGIGLETLTDATKLVNQLLNDAHVLSDADSLEVSSPGIERPLRTPAHFMRAIGSTVAVRTAAARTAAARDGASIEGERRIEGTLEAADESGIVVAGRRIAHVDIDRARTVFEWPATKVGADR